MKKEHVDSVIRDIKRNMPTIERIIKENLGVETKFDVEVLSPSHTTEQYVKLVEKGDVIKKQMTATPLLGHIFRNALIKMDVFYEYEESEIAFCVHVYYEHSFGGGRNGVEMMRFGASMKTGKTWIRQSTTSYSLSPIRWITTPNDA